MFNFNGKGELFANLLGEAFVKNINIEVPKGLIPTIEDGNFNGAILLYIDGRNVIDGFALKENEFVTSLDALNQASMLAGFSPHDLDIIKQ